MWAQVSRREGRGAQPHLQESGAPQPQRRPTHPEVFTARTFLRKETPTRLTLQLCEVKGCLVRHFKLQSVFQAKYAFLSNPPGSSVNNSSAMADTSKQWLLCPPLHTGGPRTELRKAGPREKRREHPNAAASLAVEVLVHFQRVQSPWQTARMCPPNAVFKLSPVKLLEGRRAVITSHL